MRGPFQVLLVSLCCGLFLNREERKACKDLMAFLRIPGALRGKFYIDII